MDTKRIDQILSPTEYAALRDEARRRALEARREAIDGFWSALGQALATIASALRRLPARVRSSARTTGLTLRRRLAR